MRMVFAPCDKEEVPHALTSIPRPKQFPSGQCSIRKRLLKF